MTLLWVGYFEECVRGGKGGQRERARAMTRKKNLLAAAGARVGNILAGINAKGQQRKWARAHKAQRNAAEPARATGGARHGRHDLRAAIGAHHVGRNAAEAARANVLVHHVHGGAWHGATNKKAKKTV